MISTSEAKEILRRLDDGQSYRTIREELGVSERGIRQARLATEEEIEEFDSLKKTEDLNSDHAEKVYQLLEENPKTGSELRDSLGGMRFSKFMSVLLTCEDLGYTIGEEEPEDKGGSILYFLI